MDGNPPVFFEGPEELMLSRQMLQLMGKELINVRAQLAESERHRATKEEENIQLSQELDALKFDNSALRMQITAMNPEDTKSQLLAAEASIEQLQDRLQAAAALQDDTLSKLAEKTEEVVRLQRQNKITEQEDAEQDNVDDGSSDDDTSSLNSELDVLDQSPTIAVNTAVQRSALSASVIEREFDLMAVLGNRKGVGAHLKLLKREITEPEPQKLTAGLATTFIPFPVRVERMETMLAHPASSYLVILRCQSQSLQQEKGLPPLEQVAQGYQFELFSVRSKSLVKYVKPSFAYIGTAVVWGHGILLPEHFGMIKKETQDVLLRLARRNTCYDKPASIRDKFVSGECKIHYTAVEVVGKNVHIEGEVHTAVVERNRLKRLRKRKRLQGDVGEADTEQIQSKKKQKA